MIDLTLLNRALAVAEAGSFAGAAKSLGLSQPTLSRQIAALELALGFRLFDRGRQGAIPTPLGNQVLTRASSLVQSAALLDHEIDLLRGVTIGELKVGAGVYPAYMSLGRALGRLSASHPGLRVSVTVGDWRTMADEVLEARLDLAIAELSEHIENPSLQLEPLPAHSAAFVCRPGHPLLDMPDPSLVDIFKYPFAGTRLAPRVAALLADMETAGTIDGTTGEYIPSITVNTLRMAAEVVSESDAFGIFPLSLIDPLMQPGHLQALSFQPPWLKSGYGFITLRDRTLSPAAAAFMREVRVVESEIGAEEKRILEARDQALPRQTTPSKSTIPRKRARKS